MDQLFNHPVGYYGTFVLLGIGVIFILAKVYRIIQNMRYIKWIHALGRDTAFLILDYVSDPRVSVTPKQLIDELIAYHGSHNLYGVNLASTIWYLRACGFFLNRGLQIASAGIGQVRDLNEGDHLNLVEMLLVVLKDGKIYTDKEISTEFNRRFGMPIGQGLLSSQLRMMEQSGLVEAHISITPKGLKELDRVAKGQRLQA